MARFLKNRHAAMGQMPGEAVFIGKQKMQTTEMHVIEYKDNFLNEYDPKPGDDIVLKNDCITWINVNGLHDTGLMRTLADKYKIHPLVLEDILNTGQRPRIEEYDDHIFLVTKMIRIDPADGEIHGEQLSLILGENLLITFQERPGDVFEPVRTRIRQHKGRVRNMASDYLAYSLLDCVTDHYTAVVERFGEQIEDMEDSIRINPDKALLAQINDYKHEMNYLKKTLRPARESIAAFARWDSDLIRETTRPYIKDLLDNITQSVEITDTYRDMLSDHLDIYNTTVNNRLNEVMKILTIFSAIFIPLTFIAGIYGTNFDFLPELHFKYSYPIFWGVLILIALIMLRFFKRKKWL